jgi:hypothetical protein
MINYGKEKATGWGFSTVLQAAIKRHAAHAFPKGN